jgi:hypothetical protein
MCGRWELFCISFCIMRIRLWLVMGNRRERLGFLLGEILGWVFLGEDFMGFWFLQLLFLKGNNINELNKAINEGELTFPSKPNRSRKIKKLLKCNSP